MTIVALLVAKSGATYTGELDSRGVASSFSVDFQPGEVQLAFGARASRIGRGRVPGRENAGYSRDAG